MIKVLSELKDTYIYKNLKLIFNEEDKRNNTVLFHLSNGKNDLKELVKMDYYKPNHIRSYYCPKTLSIKSAPINKIKRIDQNEVYKVVKNEYKYINYFRVKLKMYGTKNMYYDMSFENNHFFNSVTMSGPVMYGYYKNFLNEVINQKEFEGKKKVVFVKMNNKLSSDEPNNPAKILYSLIYRRMLLENDLKDITFIFYSTKQNLLFKVSNFNDINISKFKNLLGLINSLETGKTMTPTELNLLNSDSDSEGEMNISKEANKSGMLDSLMSKIKKGMNLEPKVHALTGEDIDVIDNIEEITEKFIDEHPDIDNIEDLEDSLNDNEEFLRYLNDLKEEKAEAVENKVIDSRVNKLKSAQSEVELDNVTIDSILDNFKMSSIEIDEMNNIGTLHDEIKISKLKDLDSNYNKYQNQKDFSSVITAFNNDDDIKLYVRNIEREDTSDSFNKKETITIKFRDSKNEDHTFKVDLPKIVDDRFLFLNGGKKSIAKQLTLLPIVKTKEDTVQITSNYNKIFLTRFGNKINPNTEKIRKYLLGSDSHESIKIQKGNNSEVNSNYDNTLEYDDISNNFIRIDVGDYTFRFNRGKIENEVESKGINLDGLINGNEYLLGWIKRKALIVNKEDGHVYIRHHYHNEIKSEVFAESVVKAIINAIVVTSGDETIKSDIMNINTGSRFVYSRASVIGRKFPLVIILGFYKGLENIMNSYEMEYEFLEERKKLTPDEKANYNVVKFKDGYLYYKNNMIRYSLLMNGLYVANTEEYNFDDFNDTEVYLDVFSNKYGSRNISKGINNMLNLILDPITIEVLENMDMPTDIDKLLLEGNTLLENKNYSGINNMTNYRIRGNELINAHLYKVLADAFRVYKDTSRLGTPKKITARQDVITKKLLESPLIDEYSVLNPVSEVERMGKVSYKGLSGTNSDHAFTLDMRAYDKSMLGFFGMNSPDSSKIGTVRQLSFNPKIKNTRGIIDDDIDVNHMNPSDMLTPAELLSPFTSRKADPPRIGMQVTQSKHIMPTKISDKPLFGSGVERALPQMIGSDFVFKSKQDGVVERLDEKNQLMILKYKDDTKDIVDLSPVQAKNSNGGFYITNKKDPLVSEGDSFNKSDILAKNPQFFQSVKSFGDDCETYVTGKLTKVAIASGDYTMEDSSMVTTNLSKDMSSKVTMKKTLNLGVNSNIDFMIKNGSKVKTGDPLLKFEQSFDEKEANKLLSSIGSEFDSMIDELSKNVVSSKYTGVISDIVIYYNRDMEDFTESIQKVLKKYIRNIERRKKVAKDISDENLVFPPTSKVNSDKINGEEVDGIMIEFYITYEDNMGIGDKVVFDTSLKSIIGKTIDSSKAPTTVRNTDEEISAIVSPLSIVSRMTTDVYSKLYLNKVLIELKDEVRKIVEE